MNQKVKDNIRARLLQEVYAMVDGVKHRYNDHSPGFASTVPGVAVPYQVPSWYPIDWENDVIAIVDGGYDVTVPSLGVSYKVRWISSDL